MEYQTKKADTVGVRVEVSAAGVDTGVKFWEIGPGRKYSVDEQVVC